LVTSQQAHRFATLGPDICDDDRAGCLPGTQASQQEYEPVGLVEKAGDMLNII